MNPELTWLYCPAIREDLLQKAGRSEADVVIYDLEDAVLPGQKDSAREALRAFLSSMAQDDREGLPKIHVRINDLRSPWAAADIDMLSRVEVIDAVRVPKVESPTELEPLKDSLGEVPVHALVETAKGLNNLDSICAADDIAGVSLGDADLRAELRLHGEQALDIFRVQLVVALAAHNKPAPTGSVYIDLADMDGLLAHTRHLRTLGFIGRTALHPKQLPLIREAFTPSAEEAAKARQLVDAAKEASTNDSSGAFTMEDGRFVDAPIIRQAETTLALAAATGV